MFEIDFVDTNCTFKDQTDSQEFLECLKGKDYKDIFLALTKIRVLECFFVVFKMSRINYTFNLSILITNNIVCVEPYHD